MVYHPWQELAQLPHIRVSYVDMLGSGAADVLNNTIYLNRRLHQVERRCTLTHELIHFREGHIGHQPPAVEWRVREETARLLIPLDRLRSVLAWAYTVHEAADELRVTDRVLVDRWETLRPAEIEYLHRAEGQPCMN
jgi:hypothetical protein